VIGSFICVAGMRSSCANAAEMATHRGADRLRVAHRRLVCGFAAGLEAAVGGCPVVLVRAVVRDAVLFRAGTTRYSETSRW
jgi:hypothetical protein